MSHPLGGLRSVVLFAGALLVSSPLAAQSRAVEVGADMGMDWYTDGDVAIIGIPASQLRVGIPAGETFTIEPRTQFTVLTGGGTGTSGLLDVAFGLRKDFGAADATSHPFIVFLPEALVAFGDGSDGDFGIGAAVGVELNRTERLSWRLEAGFSRFLDAGSNVLRVRIGATLYTH